MFAPSIRQTEEGLETLKQLHAKLADCANQLCAMQYREDQEGRDLIMKVAPLKERLNQAEAHLKDVPKGRIIPLDWKLNEAKGLLAKVEEGIAQLSDHGADDGCSQKSYYLANVLLVVGADDEVDFAECELVQDIAKSIGASDEDLNLANNLIAEGHYYLHKVGSFSDQLRNLEDMIRACFADGKVHPDEKELIESFAGSLGVDQDRMDLVEEWLDERMD